MRKVLGEEPKIIATVRPIAECIASFYLIDKSNLTPNQWMKSSRIYAYFIQTYEALRDAYKEYPENFCIIEYSDLCNHTQRELDRVADFIGIPYVTFSPEIQQVDENDNAWGIQDLHTLGSTIEETKLDTFKILGEDLFHFFKVLY